MPAYKTYSRRRKVYTFQIDGTISAGNDLAHEMIVAQKEKVVGVMMGLSATGTTSGSTTAMVHRTRAGTDADLLSTALGVAYNATDYYSEAAASTFQNGDLQKGDLITLDVDAVPGGADSADLVVKVITHIVNDES